MKYLWYWHSGSYEWKWSLYNWLTVDFLYEWFYCMEVRFWTAFQSNSHQHPGQQQFISKGSQVEDDNGSDNLTHCTKSLSIYVTSCVDISISTPTISSCCSKYAEAAGGVAATGWFSSGKTVGLLCSFRCGNQTSTSGPRTSHTSTSYKSSKFAC